MNCSARIMLQKALGLHLTKLHGRLINVELTVGGGGKCVYPFTCLTNILLFRAWMLTRWQGSEPASQD